jgi:hypothetical protein
MFRSLYRPAEPRAAVAPVVSELWAAPRHAHQTRQQPASATAVAPAPESDNAAPVGAPLDLFQNMRPDVRALFARTS